MAAERPILNVAKDRALDRELSDAEVFAGSLPDPRLFGLIFDRHFAFLYRFLRARLGAGAAEDVAAETLVVAFRRRADFDRARANARPWLLGIALNLAREHDRAERRRTSALRKLPPESAGDAEAATLERVAAGQSRARLADGLAALSEDERDVLLLYACAELTYREIAATLSLPIGTVRSRLHRARASLQMTLARSDENDSEPLEARK